VKHRLLSLGNANFSFSLRNNKCPEITEAIRFEEGQISTDRSIVFHMKLEEYLADIKEGHVFGPVRAVAYTN